MKNLKVNCGSGLLLLMLVWACGGQGQAPEQSLYTKSQVDSFIQVYQSKLERYLLKDASLQKQVVLNQEGIHLYTPQADTLEYSLAWDFLPSFKELAQQSPELLWHHYQDPDKIPLHQVKAPDPPIVLEKTDKPDAALEQPLYGRRIALDPGHFGMNWKEAQMEQKFIDMKLAKGKKVQFYEARLTWFTARILADELEKLGAEVLLTRELQQSALDISYTDWYQNYRDTLPDGQKPLSPTLAFFKKFRKPEFIARAEKINNFQADLCLIIHYNVDAANAPWKAPSPHNHSMAFVGGSFMKGELDTPQARFHLLRFLLTEDQKNSEQFCHEVLTTLAEDLGILPIPALNNQSFLQDYCQAMPSPGVYARNLTLARKVYGTLCYAEPLYQENKEEILRLSTLDDRWQDYQVPSRLRELAHAYRDAILRYFRLYQP